MKRNSRGQENTDQMGKEIPRKLNLGGFYESIPEFIMLSKPI